MPLHFVVDLPAAVAPGDLVVLEGAEAHHAAVVRRVRVGETVSVGDGRGVWADGRCESAEARAVGIRLISVRTDPRSRVCVELVQALAKGDRDELAVQAATELGVDVITPWQAARSVARWDAAKATKGVARWQVIAREAGKQAHRSWLPEVRTLIDLPALCARASDTRMLVLEPTAGVSLSSLSWDEADTRDVVVVVGPEGGIAPDELEALGRAGAELVRLGPEVLRTSTAGPAALAVISVGLGRW